MRLVWQLWVVVLLTTTIETLYAADDKPSEEQVGAAINNDADGEFKTAVAQDVGDVISLDPPRFGLARLEDTSFILYGMAPSAYEKIECEKSAIFSIMLNQSIAGRIGAGICRNEAMRMHDLAGHAKPGIRQIFESLVKGGANIDKSKAKKLGWSYSKKTGSNGSIIHSYPIIAVGHGIMTVPTVLLVTKQKDMAIIVQAHITNLCDGSHRMEELTPLCRDTKDALADIAQRLYLRLGGK